MPEKMYKTDKELQKRIDRNGILSLFSSKGRYKNEKTLCRLAIDNMVDIVNEVLPGAEILYIEKEKSIRPHITNIGKHGIPNSRIDIYVKTNKGDIAIEVKNPSNAYTELRNGVAQCMDYIQVINPTKTVLLSSVYSDCVPRLINGFSLPIEYIVVNRDNFAILERKTERKRNE